MRTTTRSCVTGTRLECCRARVKSPAKAWLFISLIVVRCVWDCPPASCSPSPPTMPDSGQCPSVTPGPSANGCSSVGCSGSSGNCPSTGGSGGGGTQNSIKGVEQTCNPVVLQYGTSYELVNDLTIPAPGMNWVLNHSYQSLSDGSDFSLGNKVNCSGADMFLYGSAGSFTLLFNAACARTFARVGSGPNYSNQPNDTYLVMTADTTNHQFVLTDQSCNMRWTFYDFTVSPSYLQGLLKEQSTLQLYSQGKSGFVYSYNSGGTVNQITSPTGQDYNIVFTYSSGIITQVQVQDALGNAIEQVNYTYYQNVTSPSSDIGSSGDLVQVQVSKRASGDAPGTMSIVRYTQYRYTTLASSYSSMLQAVYEHDAIQRILTSTGLSTPVAVMSQANSYGTPSIQSFASRSLTYYASQSNTSSINTPFAANENLTSEYGVSGTGSATNTGWVATETIGGCGSCGSANSITTNYFYLQNSYYVPPVHHLVPGIPGTSIITIEDTQDSAGTAVYRTIYGLGNGRLVRRAFIQNPITSPVIWCESWLYSTTSGIPYRVAEHRFPSAHTGVTSNSSLAEFLNPWVSGNDAATVNSSSGQIEVFGYNSNGLITDSWVKNGESGTSYYVSATDYGDSTNTALVTATWDYPTQTTTRSSGNQTSFSYTFYDSSTHQQFETITTTLPTVPTGQNGSGVATTTAEYYDNIGRLRWTQGGEGYIDYYAYHPTMGTLAYQAVDVNPASPGSAITSGSSGNWESVSTAGGSSNEPARSSSLPSPLLLSTVTYYDELGRQTEMTDTGGNNHYTAYANLQTISFPFWNSTTSQATLPIQVTNLNSGAQVSDQISVRASYTAISTASGAPTGFSTAPSQSDYVAWIHYTYDSTTGRLTYTDRYIDSPSSGYGTLSTDFYRTVTQYDTLGRKQYVIQVINGSVITSEVEQVTQYVYDIRDRVIQANKGVSPLGANMGSSYTNYPTIYTISQTVFDNGGVGDGNVTQTSQFYGTGSTNYTGTNYYRTYRGHLRGIEPFYMNGSTPTPIGPYTVMDVDWKGRATTTAQYSADPTWSSVLTSGGYTAYASPTSTNRLTETATLYDVLDRVYQTQKYDIAPSSGTGSNYLAQNAFYDRNNRMVGSAPAFAAGTESAFDGAGRQYEIRTVIALQSTPYSSGAYQYCAPAPIPSLSSMSGGDNGVLTLDHQSLDANGNVLETDTFEDNHDDVIGTTAGINLTNNNDYVRRTVFNWYDAANRLTTAADYGSGDTATGAGQWKYATIPPRPSSAPTASANTYLVTLYSYSGDSGRLQTATDPAGTVTKTFYDNLGRKTYVAQNWQNFVPPSTGTGNPNDRVTQYVYDGPDRVQQLVAMDPNGDGNLSDNQVTTYYYVDAVDANRNTNQVYPDSSDTGPTGTNQIKLAYNVDGSLSQRTDQRGTVLAYTYTNNRLLATESAATLGTGVDGTIQSIAHTYDTLNRPQNITSYASTGGTGTVVNDIQYAYYNGTTKVATSYQQHYGAVNTSTTLNVQYAYDMTTSGSIYSNQLRLQTDVHPNGRTIFYDYGSSSSSTAAYSATSTVREIWDGSLSGTGLAVYDYNGAGNRLAIATYPQPSFKLDHFEGPSGTYAGLDRFGRTIDQYWAGFGGTSDVDRIHYAYDYVGNRMYRQIDPAIYPTENLDQAYTYDTLHRLSTSQVGTLSGTTISGTPASQEAWTLDGLGNWAGYVTQASGTTILNQTRTTSPTNEISGVSASVGPTWTTPAYDLAGNMMTIPIPTNLTSGCSAVYDAWNRLVSLSNGSTTVATYSYDGLNRRIVKGVYLSGTLDHKEHSYFTEQWQVLEVRKEVSGTINSNPLEQFVWHPFYIDAPVLRDYDASCSGSPTRYYHAFDATFNVTTATSSSGSPVERYYYPPYGNLRFQDGSFNLLGTQQSQIGNTVTYTGGRYDAESGLYEFRRRYYHGELGCFISRDPIGYIAGVNVYEYVGDNPMNSVDPLGTRDCTPATPPSMSYGPTTYKGYGGGVGVGVSTNPSPIGGAPTKSLNCVMTRTVNVKYICTDKVSTLHEGWCYTYWRSTTTVTTTATLSFSQTETYTAPVTGGQYLYTVGIEIPIPGPPGVGGTITVYGLAPGDQQAANGYCAAGAPTWPAYHPLKVSN